jgi:dnd system-associated protein 4
MANQTRVQTRVYVPEEVGDLYNLLTAEGKRETADPVQAPFSKYKDVFLTAACLGFQLQWRKPLPKGDKKREIRLDTFNENDIDVLKAIALVDAGDINVLLDMGEILTIAEEYAYSGIRELEMRLLKTNGQPLWNLASLIQEESNSTK